MKETKQYWNIMRLTDKILFIVEVFRSFVKNCIISYMFHINSYINLYNNKLSTYIHTCNNFAEMKLY